jgi:hypothetical protein
MDANKVALKMTAGRREKRERRTLINDLRNGAASPIYSTACATITA